MWKKSFNFVAVILATVTVIGLSSCKDKVYYSCDPTIDAIIRQNLPKYEGMTREEWKKLPDSLKLAAFVAMSPEMTKEFWKGKYNEMMDAKFFKDSEKVHISKLYNYLLSIDGLFTEKFTEDKERKQKVLDYYKEWAIYGIDNFGWYVIDALLITEDMEELTEEYIEHVKHNAPSGATELTQAGKKCDCKHLFGCGVGYYCLKDPCEGTKKGCGIIFRNDPCTKKCDYPDGVTADDFDDEVVERIEQLLKMPQRELLDMILEEMKQ